MLNKEITDLIDTATETGNKIPVKALFSEFRQPRKDALLTADPETQRRVIDNIAKQISIANKKLGRDFLTPVEVQKLKQNIYKETQSLYAKTTQAPIKGRAKQAVARAAKQALENIFPEIKHLNAKEGSLLALQKEIERSASRISNRDILGISMPLKGTAGGAAAGGPGVIGGLALGLLDTPHIKAKLAIVLNELKEKGVQVSPNATALRLGVMTPERVK